LPHYVLFLVTSRLPAECPVGLADRITAKFGTGSGYVAKELDLNDKEYVELLLKYFRDRLQPYFRDRIVNYWTPILKDKLKFEKGGRDDRLTKDPGVGDGLKVDWKNLTNKYPRYSGQPVPVASILHILDRSVDEMNLVQAPTCAPDLDHVLCRGQGGKCQRIASPARADREGANLRSTDLPQAGRDAALGDRSPARGSDGPAGRHRAAVGLPPPG
jgi:hypothetical protein